MSSTLSTTSVRLCCGDAAAKLFATCNVSPLGSTPQKTLCGPRGLCHVLPRFAVQGRGEEDEEEILLMGWGEEKEEERKKKKKKKEKEEEEEGEEQRAKRTIPMATSPHHLTSSTALPAQEGSTYSLSVGRVEAPRSAVPQCRRPRPPGSDLGQTEHTDSNRSFGLDLPRLPPPHTGVARPTLSSW